MTAFGVQHITPDGDTSLSPTAIPNPIESGTKSQRWDLNPQPPHYECDALPIEATLAFSTVQYPETETT